MKTEIAVFTKHSTNNGAGHMVLTTVPDKKSGEKMELELMKDCLAAWMQHHSLSVAEVTDMLGFKSKTSVFRLLKGEGETAWYEISGRVDTITAPELLKAFESGEKCEKIIIDAKRMQYISSSGLRVLMIKRKSVKDNECLRILHCTEEVKEIFEVTGFDSLFEIS